MKNYYIDRNKDKTIIGVYARPQYKDQEKLSENNVEMVAFLHQEKIKTERQEVERIKIGKEIMWLAVDSLINKGELPPDYEIED